MKYRPEIDGLRAVAVVPVILFHAGLGGFAGGFVGVDVFFVISGYLITTLIVHEMEEGRFSLAAFYFRRARRIIPALAVVTVATAAGAWAIMQPGQLEEFSRSLVAVALFGSNVLFWRESGYFATASEEKPLLHTWSLAVEEQFYIAFPLALMAAFAFGIRRLPQVAIAIAALASFAVCEWASRAYPTANFYLLPMRAWELFAGSLCAFALLRREPQRNEALAALGLAAILIPVFLYSAGTPFPSVYALAPVLGTVLIVLFATPQTVVGRLLVHKATVGLGLISYSAYLWHFPLFAFARIEARGEPSTPLMLTLAAASLVLAWLTWRFVEQPIRRIRPSPAAMRRGFAAVAAATAAFAGVGVLGVASQGFETLWVETRGEETRRRYLLFKASQQEHPVAVAEEPCRYFTDRLDEDTTSLLARCYDAHGPAIAIVGDSHATDVYTAVTLHSSAPFVVVFSRGGCSPTNGRPDCAFLADLPEFFRERPGLFERVIYSQSGRPFFVEQDGRQVGERRFGDVDAPEFDPSMASIEPTLAYIDRLSDAVASGEVAWLGPRLEPWINPYVVMEVGCEPGAIRLRPNLVRSFERLDAAFREAALHWDDEGVEYVSEQGLVRLDPDTDYVSCDALYWADEDHWSLVGADRFGGRIVEALLD